MTKLVIVRSIKKHSPRRGAVAVEMALVLPVLLLVLFGAADLGRFAHTMVAVSNASRAGAGFAGSNPYTPTSRPLWEAKIRQMVQNELESLNGFDGDRMVVTITPQVDAEDRRRVSVRVEYRFETRVSWLGLPSSLRLVQTSTFPMLR